MVILGYLGNCNVKCVIFAYRKSINKGPSTFEKLFLFSSFFMSAIPLRGIDIGRPIQMVKTGPTVSRYPAGWASTRLEGSTISGEVE